MSGRLDTGDTVGDRWQVSHLLGSGPTGEVYEVYDVVEDRQHSLKLFQPEALGNKEQWDRFAETVRSASDALGPLGDEVTEVTVDDASGSPFVVSKRIAEPTLQSHVARGATLSTEGVARLLARIAPALDRAHGAGVFHGNLKPSNVFVSGPDASVVHFTDAGAQLLTDEEWGASPEWCAPELMHANSSPSATGDLYALGLLAFYAMTGKTAFAAADPLKRPMLKTAAASGLRSATARAAAAGARIDLRLDRWFSRALDASPTRRFGSATEMANAYAKIVGVAIQLEELGPLDVAPPRTKAFPPSMATPAAPSPAKAPDEAPAPSDVMPSTKWETPAGKRGARGGHESDSSIAAVSVKPLLFSDDIPARRPSAPEAPAEAPPPEPSEDEDDRMRTADPMAVTVLGEIPKSLDDETLRGIAPQGTREPYDAAGPASTRKPAVRVSLTPPPPDQGVAVAREPGTPATPPGSVAVPLPVLIAVGAAILGMGLAAIAAVLWLGSSRTSAPEQAETLEAPAAPVAPAPPTPTERKPAPAGADDQPPKSVQTAPAEDANEATQGIDKDSASKGDDVPPAGMARVRFTCTPVECDRVFCDAQGYDPGEPLDLTPGKHVCKGAASGYAAPSVTLHLAEGRTTHHEFELVVRKKSSSGKSNGSSTKKPCGTFINPCK